MTDFSEHLTKRHDQLSIQIRELEGARDRVADCLDSIDERLNDLRRLLDSIIEKLAEPVGMDA